MKLVRQLFAVSVFFTLYMCVIIGLINLAPEKNKLEKPLCSSCLIRSSGGVGSGVYLDTGYLITCSHVVDADSDGYIRANERIVECQFFNKAYPYTQKFEVIYSSRDVDMAILQPLTKLNYDKKILEMIPKTTANEKNGRPGDRIIAIGASRGEPLTISEGFIGFSKDEFQLASCYISTGNSGGGIFNNTNKLLGLATAVFMSNNIIESQVILPSFDKDGEMKLLIGRIDIPIQMEINNICAFTPIVNIRNDLNSKSLGFLLDKQPERTLLDRLKEPWTHGIIRVGFNLTLFFAFLVFIRKHLFG